MNEPILQAIKQLSENVEKLTERFEAFRDETRERFEEVRDEISQRVDEVRDETNKRIETFRAETQQHFESLEREIGWIRGKMEGRQEAESNARARRAERIAIGGVIVAIVSAGIALASLLF